MFDEEEHCMAELTNCSKCGRVYVKNQFRDLCDSCYKEEERAFETVYTFIRQRVNRTASIPQVVEATGVEEELLFKFVRNGRLKLSQFPNLGYPCEKCGTLIREGRFCGPCAADLQLQIEQLKQEEEREREIKQRERKAANTYYSINKNKR